MTAQSPPAYLQNGSHGAELFRRTVGSLLPSGVRQKVGTSARGGCLDPGDLAVTQNGTPNMSVNVAAGQVWIPGTIGANQGPYYGLNDATVNLAIAAANASNPRIDLVCATVDDAAYSGSTNDWKLQVVTGTPTAGATLSNLSGAPALPSNSLLLAYVLVPANASSIVTADLLDKRVFAGIEPACRVYRAAAFTSTTSGQTTPFDTVVVDNFGGFSVATSKYTVPVAGLYLAFAQVLFSGAADGAETVLQIMHQSGADADGPFMYQGAGGFASDVALALVPCAAGDTLYAQHTTANGGLAMSVASTQNFMSIVKVSD